MGCEPMVVERERWRRLCILCILGLMVLQGSTVVSQSSTEDGSLGEVVWPPEAHRSPADLRDIGRTLLNVSDSTVLGVHPTTSFDVQRINETASRITIDRDGRDEQTFIQSHLPPRVSTTTTEGGIQKEQVDIPVRPHQLQPVISVPVRNSTSFGFSVMGPPPTFNVTWNGTSRHDETADAQALFRRLGLPAPRDSSQNRPMYARAGETYDASGFPLYSTDPTCVERSEGRCVREVQLVLECGCTTRVWSFHPAPGDELTELVNGSVAVRSDGNRGTIVMDDDGDVLRVSVGLVVDLDTSAVLDPVQARSLVVDDIRQRGYRLGRLSELKETRLEIVLAPGQIEPTGARYHWEADLVDTSLPEDESNQFGDVRGTMVQDARTGEVVAFDTRTRTPTTTPAPGLTAVLAATATALWLAGRRRPWER